MAACPATSTAPAEEWLAPAPTCSALSCWRPSVCPSASPPSASDATSFLTGGRAGPPGRAGPRGHPDVQLCRTARPRRPATRQRGGRGRLLLAGAITVATQRGRRPSAGCRSSPPSVPRGMTFAALAVVFVVFAHWGLFVKSPSITGISNFDSLTHPHALRRLDGPEPFGGRYPLPPRRPQPANSAAGIRKELLHATGILLTHHNAVALRQLRLAGLRLPRHPGALGRPYGRGPLAVVAAAVLLECNALMVRAPGTAKERRDGRRVAAGRRCDPRQRPGGVLGENGGEYALGWPLAAAGLAEQPRPPARATTCSCSWR